MNAVRLFLSPAHIYTGHYGRPAGSTPMIEQHRLRLEEGRGIVGDRYHGCGAGHKGQITFFSEETWLRLRGELGVVDRGPGVFRRNVVVRGADLVGLIGRRFELQGLGFEGTEYCKPCFWMDQAFAPGTLSRLADWRAGGLRACILTSGELLAEAGCGAAATSA